MMSLYGVLQAGWPASAIPAAALPLLDASGTICGYIAGIEQEQLQDYWDRQQALLKLARPVCGSSGLFYRQQGQGVWFASQLQQLLSLGGEPLQLERDALIDNLILGRVLPPYTLYRGIFSLAAGQRLQLSCGAPQLQLLNDACWPEPILAALDNTEPAPTASTPPSNGRRLWLGYDSDYIGAIADNVEILSLAAADNFDAIPDSVNSHGLPLGDLLESALQGASAQLRGMQPLHCDLAAPLLQALPQRRRTPASVEFLASGKLRAHLPHWRSQRESLLWQPIRQLLQRSGNNANAEVLFRLCHILPERRLALTSIAAQQRLPLHFDCADTAQLSQRIASALRGQQQPWPSAVGDDKPLLLLSCI